MLNKILIILIIVIVAVCLYLLYDYSNWNYQLNNINFNDEFQSSINSNEPSQVIGSFMLETGNSINPLIMLGRSSKEITDISNTNDFIDKLARMNVITTDSYILQKLRECENTTSFCECSKPILDNATSVTTDLINLYGKMGDNPYFNKIADKVPDQKHLIDWLAHIDNFKSDVFRGNGCVFEEGK